MIEQCSKVWSSRGTLTNSWRCSPAAWSTASWSWTPAARSLEEALSGNRPLSLSVAFLFRTSGKETDPAIPLGMEKYERFYFSPWKHEYLARNRPESMMAHVKVELGRNRSRICACENKPHAHLYNRNPRTENEPGRESSWGKCHPALCLSHLPSPFLPSPLIAVIFSKHLVILLNLPHLPLPPKLNFLHDTSFKTSFTEPMGRVKCIADIPIYQTAQV